MSDEKIDFEKEAKNIDDKIIHEGTTVEEVAAWGRSIARRVEEDTIQRCLNRYEEFLGKGNEFYIQRLYAEKEK